MQVLGRDAVDSDHDRPAGCAGQPLFIGGLQARLATDITGGYLTPEMNRAILAGIPMGRAGEASDVAGCALFLASALSAYCTGTEVDVNGGSLIH